MPQGAADGADAEGRRGSGFFKKMLSSAGSSADGRQRPHGLEQRPGRGAEDRRADPQWRPDTARARTNWWWKPRPPWSCRKTAVLSLEILAANSPKDRDVAIKYAKALADSGEVGRAEKILADLYRSFPTDNELGQALKDLSARKTLDEGGYDALADGTGSYRDILKDKEEAVSLEQQNRQVKTEDVAERLINEYETRLKTEPKNLKLLRSLAELYTQKKQFDRALGYYEQIKVIGGGRRRVAGQQHRGHDGAEVRPSDRSCWIQSAPDYADKAAKLQAEKQAYQLAECQKRAERFPTDLQIRFELGQLYFQAGKIGEAIQEFQKAQGNPHRRIAALNYPGAMLRQAKNVRPRDTHLARRPQGEAGLRRGEEGTDLQSRLRARKHGQEGRSDQAVRDHLRGGHRLPGRGGEGGCILRRRAKCRLQRSRRRRNSGQSFQRHRFPSEHLQRIERRAASTARRSCAIVPARRWRGRWPFAPWCLCRRSCRASRWFGSHRGCRQ